MLRVLGISLVLVAAVACGGSTIDSSVKTSTTIGQELQDLEKARVNGLISDQEFQRVREMVLNRYN